MVNVSAVNSVGAGPGSHEAQTRTLPSSPTQSPQNITITALSSRALEITWVAPDACTASGIITSYVLMVDGFSSTIAVTTRQVVTNLAPFTT